MAGRGSNNRQEWEAFEGRLAAALGADGSRTRSSSSRSPCRCSGGPAPYVQYAHSGRRGFRAEASGNHFLAPSHALSPDAEERLGEFGWQWPEPVGEDDRNFHREWPNPAPWAGGRGADRAHPARRVRRCGTGPSLRFLHRGVPGFQRAACRAWTSASPADRSPRPAIQARHSARTRCLRLTGLNRRLEDALKPVPRPR